jgi:hypothetical protein
VNTVMNVRVLCKTNLPANWLSDYRFLKEDYTHEVRLVVVDFKTKLFLNFGPHGSITTLALNEARMKLPSNTYERCDETKCGYVT